MTSKPYGIDIVFEIYSCLQTSNQTHHTDQVKPCTRTICYDREWLHALNSNISDPSTTGIEVFDESVTAVLQPQAPGPIVYTSATTA